VNAVDLEMRIPGLLQVVHATTNGADVQAQLQSDNPQGRWAPELTLGHHFAIGAQAVQRRDGGEDEGGFSRVAWVVAYAERAEASAHHRVASRLVFAVKMTANSPNT
jgi:hypothetical protein